MEKVMHIRNNAKNQRGNICPRCNSASLSILNHPIDDNSVLETAICPECEFVWKDQWVLAIYPTSRT